jgi:hypothetical protein
MEITGTLKMKSDTQKVSDKFQKRDFVVTDNSSQYPQHISLQLSQDKCGLIDNVNIGDELKVSINLRGREWTSPKGEVKYFNTIEAWKIEKSGATPKKQVAESSQQLPDSEEDELPF